MPAPPSPSAVAGPLKRKTWATWLALVGGVLGLHRFYLRGMHDLAGWACWLPTGIGAYGLWRARTLGLDDRLSWALIPWIGAMFSIVALQALMIGLSSAPDWNRRLQPWADPDDPAGATTWVTVIALVLAMLLGATALIATIAFVAQRVFEFAGP